MEIFTRLPFYTKFNYNLGIRLKLALVYLANEAVLVTEDDNVYHYVNNAAKSIGLLCNHGIKDLSYWLQETATDANYTLFAISDDKVFTYVSGGEIKVIFNKALPF